MTVMVALLRGVNVGGAGRLAMAQLRELVAGCGHVDVRTHIQSGNVVFRSSDADVAHVAGCLRTAIRDGTGLDPEVHVRTVEELAGVVDANPFVAAADDPKQLHVSFFDQQPDPIELDPAAYEPEAWAVGDRAVYLFLPSGIGRSKLATHLARRAGATGTTRNWRTTTTILQLARNLT